MQEVIGTKWLRVVCSLGWVALTGASFQACGSDDSPATPACGPGTALVNGQCVVAAQCGKGTVLKEGECVPETTGGSGGGGTSGQGGAGVGGANPAGASGKSGSSGQGGSTGQGGSGEQSGSSGQGGAAFQGGASGQAGSPGQGGSDSGQGGEGGSEQVGGEGGQGGSDGGVSGEGGSAGSEQGGAGTGGMATGGTGVAGQGGNSAGVGGAGQAGVSGGGQAGGTAGGAAGADTAGGAGGEAGVQDDPCPDEFIDFNCDPACGEVHPGCMSIGCNYSYDFTMPTSKKKILIRTPSQPQKGPGCAEKCEDGKTHTMIAIELKEYTIPSWYYRFRNITGGWGTRGGEDSLASVCISKLVQESVCLSQKATKGYSKNFSVYAFSGEAKARNITIERFVDNVVEHPECP
jgi:hypothetical protein